uniref:Zinc finger, C2H2 type n=1 Tax=Angiostrongylus cantonensis TaxID=6313 RepID=A0A0K0CT22_ANGCA
MHCHTIRVDQRRMLPPFYPCSSFPKSIQFYLLPTGPSRSLHNQNDMILSAESAEPSDLWIVRNLLLCFFYRIFPDFSLHVDNSFFLYSSSNFTYRCKQCTMVFRSESALRSHSILHLFSDHPQDDESSMRCELCAENFSSRTSLITHINSVQHLHRAKKQLEAQGSIDLSTQKPFRCNVCKIGYGQGATLDIHLRSVAHQSRMSKIAELVSAGDVNPSKPVLEQPGGPPQKIIRELLIQMLHFQALSTHYDLTHSTTIPDSVVRSFCERLCEAIPESASSQTNGHHLSPVASRTVRDDGEPPEKRSRSDATVAGRDYHNSSSFRQYFDINNSPSEAQVKEMSLKAGLPEKVIKHWFRNTLFKERQRDKDSPYNFSVPPQMGIDLDTYEKTGETKVVPLAVSEVPILMRFLINRLQVKRDPSPKPTEAPSVPSLNLQAMMQQMHQFMDPSGIISGSISQHSQSSTSGRRANRTRFTDYQLRTLQQFFDKQAYPKDDDLEVLSKKLQLSPRVIVVWFQNARQKARKIYENQPNHENADRFVRTPGCNFQCKRCNLVFQRYYELIQHQQKKCYKDDCLAQANDNKIVEESLTDEEKAQLLQQTALASINDAKPADFAKLLGASKSSTEAILKLCETANSSSPSSTFYKRCPFCGLLFRSRSSLQEHIPARHPQQHSATPVDIELLPNAEDVKSVAGVLDLSNTSRDTLSMSPFLGHSDDDPTEFVEESTTSYVGGPSQSRSPTSNKRYRTHLTPTQVHVMKSVFGDYKTPSMTECETLGREIGLHKRVVQVWFQNARAKERKTRSSDEEVNRSTMTSCSLCGVEYSGRVTLQEHLFSLQHLTCLKGQLLSETAHSDSAPSTATAIPAENAQLAALPPLVYDPMVFGTPVSMLQIPESVKARIKSDITSGYSSSRFTQDGLNVDDLRQKLSADEASNLCQKEVGWACSSCTNVFQQEALLKNHQRSVCQGSDVFTLVQIHYECSVCSLKLGTQTEYRSHCETTEHRTNLQNATAVSAIRSDSSPQ